MTSSKTTERVPMKIVAPLRPNGRFQFPWDLLKKGDGFFAPIKPYRDRHGRGADYRLMGMLKQCVQQRSRKKQDPDTNKYLIIRDVHQGEEGITIFRTT